jgi:hypothetical protein
VIPFSFCIPKTCDKNSQFSQIVKTLDFYVNKQIAISKKLIDFDKLDKYVPDIDKPSYDKIKLLTNVFFNQTQFKFESQVPTESYELDKASTRGLL